MMIFVFKTLTWWNKDDGDDDDDNDDDGDDGPDADDKARKDCN